MSHQTPLPASENDVVLETRHVTKRFPGVLANSDVNIKLHRGEIMALLGENGAGKSTLMNIIYGLYHQDEGDVLLKGQEVRFSNPREAIHSGIGMVHQHFQLIPVMSVAENVVLGEENETPTWRNLFSGLFTFLTLIASFLLLKTYNHPLTYATFSFAIIAFLLPIVLSAVLLKIGTWLIPPLKPRAPQWRQWLIRLFQLAGLIAVTKIAFDAGFSNGEILATLTGMLIFALLAYALPRILLFSPDDRIHQLLPTQLRNLGEIPRMLSFLLALAGIVLGIVGILWLLFQSAFTATPDTDRVLTFLAFLGIYLAAVSVLSFALSWGLAAIFKSWQQVVAGLRLMWGIAWRLALIGVALWIGGLVQQASRMAIITTMLQTELPFTLEGDHAQAEGSREFSLRWGNIERINGFNAQTNAILAEIDKAYYQEKTYEFTSENHSGRAFSAGYIGFDTSWRNAVATLPIKIRDVVVAVLLVAFAALALSTWRGHRALPSHLENYDLALILGIAAIFAYTLWTNTDELASILRLVIFLIALISIGWLIWHLFKDRRQDPDRIRPVAALDTIIDALTDFAYTLLSIRNHRHTAERVHALSRQYGLEVDPDAIVEKLPVGLQQRVEIIKALYRQADILILDEPTAVLTPQEGQELFKIMRDLSSQGVSIIFITHKLKEVFEVATHIVVMRGGEVVGTTTPQEATEASLAAMMVGREVLLRVEKTEAHPAAAILRVDNLYAYDDRGALALDGTGFEVKAGEVLGIAGVQGNGQTELVEVLTGLRSMSEGAVELLGQELRPEHYPTATPLQRLKAVLLDAALIGALTIPVSYFWSYFRNEVADFKLLSLQSLFIFIVLDALITLTSWQLWGATFGKAVSSLQIAQQDNDHRPTWTALALRYILQTLTRYSIVGYPLIAAIQANIQKASPSTFAGRFNQNLTQAWYDRLPFINGHVLHQVAITPRRIKDLQTSHVPEDRHRYGMLKAFSVEENLILNDYYTPRHAQQPTRLQLPFLTLAYGTVFGLIFATLGYLWLHMWNKSLWHGLLDSYGTPRDGDMRAIPIGRGMSALQRNYLNDPLLVSILSVLVLVAICAILSYIISNFIFRYLTHPYRLAPLLLLAGLACVGFLIAEAVIEAISPSLYDNLHAKILGSISALLSLFPIDLDGYLDKAALAMLGLIALTICAELYNWVSQAAATQSDYQRFMARFHNSYLGKFIEVENQYGLILNLQDSLDYSNRLIEEYDIRTPSALTSGGSLSGGNQQKMVVAREFNRQPRLLIASQPTRGIDVGSIEFIHKRIIQQRDQGAAVLLVSAELDEIMSLSDRIAVMYRGKIIKVLDAKGASREELGLLMAGISR